LAAISDQLWQQLENESQAPQFIIERTGHFGAKI